MNRVLHVEAYDVVQAYIILYKPTQFPIFKVQSRSMGKWSESKLLICMGMFSNIIVGNFTMLMQFGMSW